MKSKILKPAYLFTTLLLLGAVYVLLPQADTIGRSLSAIKHADFGLLLAGLLLVYLTYLAAAYTLVSISLKPVKYKRTLLVQFASGFATKLVPAGIGGFALNTRYLTKNRHSLLQAGSVMALNNLLGLAGHVLIILGGVFLSAQGFGGYLQLRLPDLFWVALLPLVFAAAVVILLWARARLLAAKLSLEIFGILKIYIKRPLSLLRGLLGALCVTLLLAACLWLCALSLGINLSLLEVLWVLTVGLIGIAVTPTPGGIGGAEAALTAGLVAAGLDTGPALSVALAYRLLSYWLPIIPGALLFHYLLKKRYI